MSVNRRSPPRMMGSTFRVEICRKQSSARALTHSLWLENMHTLSGFFEISKQSSCHNWCLLLPSLETNLSYGGAANGGQYVHAQYKGVTFPTLI